MIFCVQEWTLLTQKRNKTMSSLGELFFSLGLDSDKFDKAIEAAKKKVAELTGEASISVNADASRVAEQVQEELKEVTGKKAKISLDIDSKSKASVEELVEDIRQAKVELERLKTSEAWNTSAIGRQNGFIKSLERQLEAARAVKTAATEASKAMHDAIQPSVVQHVVREEDIELVHRMTSALEKQAEQLEIQNRLRQGQIDAAEKNKAERLAKAEELKRKREALKAEKEAIAEEKRLAKEAANARKTAEREEKDNLKNLEKQIKYAQKQEAIREKAFSQVENARMRSMGAEISTLSVYESPEYKREQLLLKRQFEEQDRIAKELERLEKEEAKLEEKARRAKEARSRRNEYISGRMTEQMLDSIDSIGRQTPEIKALNDYYRELERSSSAMASKQSHSELQAQLVQLNRLEQAIRKLQHMKVDLDTSDVDKDSEDYKKATAALDAYIDKLEEMQGSGKRLSKNKVDDVLGADMSDLIRRAGRVRTGGKFIGEDLEETKDKATALGEVLGEVFNYYMIERFIRNLYTIGGEFQKQQIALQAMIGDVDKANSIFERTKAAAVMSPFTFSELASYTKQMAAYGIEYEELYDTTKRLADISAGVGVDMGRLILAFGQVRSAAVLRGQELRQFTEAGIPMVNELAKAFSNLEKREVKAAEVFDKISRREVSFGMVKDVLFEMTDPGGRFYEMQGELAQSLAGQWSNLKDAWEIMIAEIANGTNGPLNTLASVTRGIINEWRLWLPIISGVVTAVTVLNTALRITNTLATAGIIAKAATIATPWVAAITALTGITAALVGFKSAIGGAAEAQERFSAEMETSLSKLSENEATANRYLDILSKQATKESDKNDLLRRQKLTLEALRTMYGDIVQSTKLEELTTEKILELRQKIAAATGKQSEELINSNVESASKKLSDAEARLKELESGASVIEDYIWDADGRMIKSYRPASESEIKEQRDKVTSLLDLYNKAIERRNDFFNRKENLAQEDLSGWRQKAEELIKGTTLQAPKDDQSMLEYFNYLKEEYDAAKSEFEKYAENNPITAANKASAKALRDAANMVNVGLGGVSFLEKKKEEKPDNKDAKEAERKAKEVAQAFADGVKAEINRISSQWDLYKQLFEATGNKEFAMTAFNITPVWDEAANQMYEAFEKAVEQQGFEGTISFGLSDALAKEHFGELYDSWKAIKDRIEKNSIDLKVNVANTWKESMSVADKIKAEEAKKLEALKNFTIGTPEYEREAAKFDKVISDLKAELFALSPEFQDLFVDTTGMARREVKALYNDTKDLVQLIRRGKEKKNNDEETIGYEFTDADGKTQIISVERYEELMRLLDKLKDKSQQASTSLKRVWDAVFKGGKLGSGDKEGTFEGAAEDVGALAEATAQASREISSMFDALGNESMADAFSFVGDMFDGVQGLSNAAASFASGDVLGGIFGGVSAVTGIISSIASYHDKKLDRAMQKSQLEVQKLTNQYKNLEKTLERQLGSATAGQAAKMLESLKKQREELQEQYGLEDDKKKTDKTKLEDYKQQIAELDDQIKHFYEDLASEQYGVDIKGWAGQMADALTEAFAKGEDAAAAFDKTVSEILSGLVKEMIAMEVIMPAMDKLRDYMFKDGTGIFALGSDGGSSMSEKEAIGLTAQLGSLSSTIGDAQKIWDAINEASNGALENVEGAEKSGLSKGLQSITEDTADLLASYINGMRADLSMNRTLIEQLVSVDVPKMSYLAEAQLQQLQMVVANTKRNADAADRIYELINKVVDKGSNKLKI